MAANQNVTQLTQQSGSAALTSLFYAVINGSTDTGLPLSVFVNSLGLTGTPTAPTAATNNNTTQIASTAFVQNQLTSTLAAYAPLASPTFTGTVTIPTIALSGGAINGTTVGATTPSTGSFTTLASSGLANLSSLSTSSATISGGTINSTSVGATTPSTGKFTTLQATGLVTLANTIGIAGTATNDSAQAGSWGEYASNALTGTSMTSGTAVNVGTLSLTAGDWDVMGTFTTVPAGTTTTSLVAAGISTTTNTLPTANTGAETIYYVSAPAGGGMAIATPTVRISLTTTTTVFLVGFVQFAVSTMTGNAFMRARRVR